jgi:hypothetical protein
MRIVIIVHSLLSIWRDTMSDFDTNNKKFSAPTGDEEQASSSEERDEKERPRGVCQSCGGALATQLEFCPGCLDVYPPHGSA